jgi:hypothetical protein
MQLRALLSQSSSLILDETLRVKVLRSIRHAPLTGRFMTIGLSRSPTLSNLVIATKAHSQRYKGWNGNTAKDWKAGQCLGDEVESVYRS